MGKWIVRLFILLIIVTLIGFGFLYFFTGLNSYIKTAYTISKLSGEMKQQAVDGFYGKDEQGIYTGILSGITANRVWIWSNNRLKSFVTDEYSVYSFFNACSDEILSNIGAEKTFSIGRSVGTDILSWSQKVKTGDYVIVNMATEGNGGALGNLREAIGYDWFVFMPTDIRKQCKN